MPRAAHSRVIVRLSLTLIRNEQMLLVREPGTLYLFDPGGERVLEKDDEDTLVEKIHQDLGIVLIKPLDLWTTYRAPAVHKPEGTIVENRCYFPNRYQPAFDLRNATKECVWWPAPLSPVSLALLQKVEQEGYL